MKPRRRVVIAAVVVSLIVASIVILPSIKRHVERVNCRKQMRAILSVAVHLWPSEHDGYLPSDFASMSNELATTRILICPADHTRLPVADWSSFNSEHSSYEIASPRLRKTDTNSAFLRCRIHDYSGYPDGRLVEAVSR